MPAAGTRLSGARLLHTTLVHAGSAAERHTDALVPTLCGAVSDDDSEVAGRVVTCVHVLGTVVSASLWLPLVLDQLAKASQQTAAQVASTLVVLSGLLHAAATANSSKAYAHLDLGDLLKVHSWALPDVSVPGSPYGHRALIIIHSPQRAAVSLASEDIRAIDHSAVQLQLLATCTNVVKLAGPSASSFVIPLLTVLLQLKADPSRTVRQLNIICHHLPP